MKGLLLPSGTALQDSMEVLMLFDIVDIEQEQMMIAARTRKGQTMVHNNNRYLQGIQTTVNNTQAQ